MLVPYLEPSSSEQYKYQKKYVLLFNVVFTLDSKSVMVECLFSCAVGRKQDITTVCRSIMKDENKEKPGNKLIEITSYAESHVSCRGTTG